MQFMSVLSKTSKLGLQQTSYTTHHTVIIEITTK